MAAAVAESINEHVELLQSGTVQGRFASIMANSLTISRQYFENESNASYIERIQAAGPNGIDVLHKYFGVVSPRPRAVLETLQDAEGLLAMWAGAINQIKDHFAVLEAASEDDGNKAYTSTLSDDNFATLLKLLSHLSAHQGISSAQSHLASREMWKSLGASAQRLRTDWHNFTHKPAQFGWMSSPATDPFIPLEQIRQKFATELVVLRVAMLLYTYDSSVLAMMLFTAFRGDSNLPLEGLHNWPAILNVLRAISDYTKRLKKPYIILCRKECKYLRAKLKFVASLVFNSAENRAAVPVQEKREFLDPQVALLPRPAPLPPPSDSVSSAQYHCDLFRNLAQLQHSIKHIEGDGNCFFRAVIRFIFPAMPRELEDMYSIMLRERVNNMPLSQRSKERLEGFEIEKESDAVTMAKVGVWADHTQIERLSEYLRTNIWLVHLRDRKLVMRPNGRLVPGEEYRIGHYPDADGEERDRHRPIVLYYTPAPGHYESLIFERVRNNLPYWTHIACCRNGGEYPAIPSEILCDAYFALESDFVDADRHTAQDWTAVVSGEAAAVREQRDRLVDDIARGTACLKHLLDRLGPNILSSSAVPAPAAAAALEASVLPQSAPMLELSAEILRPLIDDALVIVEDEVVNVGRGPLSQLIRKLRGLRVPQSDDFTSLHFAYEKAKGTPPSNMQPKLQTFRRY